MSSESEKYYLDEHGGCAQCIRKKERIAELEQEIVGLNNRIAELAAENTELRKLEEVKWAR